MRKDDLTLHNLINANKMINRYFNILDKPMDGAHHTKFKMLKTSCIRRLSSRFAFVSRQEDKTGVSLFSITANPTIQQFSFPHPTPTSLFWKLWLDLSCHHDDIEAQCYLSTCCFAIQQKTFHCYKEIAESMHAAMS